MYVDSESCVRLGKERRGWFEITTGVRHRDVLSPLMFNVVLDDIVRKVKAVEGGWMGTGGGRLTDLDYADDISLMSDGIDSRKMMIDVLSD